MTKPLTDAQRWRKPKATKAEMAARAEKRANGQLPIQKMGFPMLPAFAAEQRRMFASRVNGASSTSDTRICNASMKHTVYKTGDGEVLTVPRPGSLRAFGLPSRGTT
jgi:homogentisate 1,2-dioxygenase